MTRGNFVLITNTANWMSIQFNGDMYPSCNGKFVYHMLESVETYDDLAAAILKFDGECFGYADMRFGCANMHNIDMAPKSISDNIDFSKDYFAKTISMEACRNCKFDKVILSDSIKIIDKYSFSQSWNLKEIEGGKNVEEIRSYAFFDCRALNRFVFPTKLKDIGGDAFCNTKSNYLKD